MNSEEREYFRAIFKRSDGLKRCLSCGELFLEADMNYSLCEECRDECRRDYAKMISVFSADMLDYIDHITEGTATADWLFDELEEIRKHEPF